jgi:PRTRC genetic system protein F
MERDYAKLLLLFWDEGIRPKKAGPVLAMARDVLDQWIKPQVKDLAAITQWSIAVGAFSEYEFEDNASNASLGELRLGIVLTDTNVRFMENRIGKIEAETKGLGEAALYWLTRTGYRTINVLTPEVARQVAEFLWWQGESDEQAWKENLLDEGYDPQELEGLIGPKKFDSSFPGWVLNPAKPDLSRFSPKTGDGKKILAILHDMETFNEPGPLLPYLLPDSHDSVYWGGYLAWHANNCPVLRLLDDHFEMANQGADYMTELSGVEAIPRDADAFQEWKLRMEKGFRQLNRLDQLVLLTTEEY